MKISDLKEGTGKVSLEAKIVSKEEPRQVSTKFGETQVANATIEDDTGRFKLSLWGADADIPEGSKISIENGFVSSYREELQLSAGKFGKITVVEG
ncbi:MAG: DNA-binding protein [Nanoarchaeota archaeon]|nr:DNA-binding protein [Nanoarchaeota archaeon]